MRNRAADRLHRTSPHSNPDQNAGSDRGSTPVPVIASVMGTELQANQQAPTLVTVSSLQVMLILYFYYQSINFIAFCWTRRSPLQWTCGWTHLYICVLGSNNWWYTFQNRNQNLISLRHFKPHTNIMVQSSIPKVHIFSDYLHMYGCFFLEPAIYYRYNTQCTRSYCHHRPRSEHRY